MFDFIPLENYTDINYHFLFMIAIVLLVSALAYRLEDDKGTWFFSVFGIVFIVLLIFYMGLRPISGKYFGDTSTYAQGYKLLQEGRAVKIEKDYLFNYFMAFCSRIMDIHSFLLIIEIFYIVPLILFSKKYFGKYWFFAMFIFIGSLSFWTYGVNGIRNGLGTSLFILGLCFYNDRKLLLYVFLFLSYFMHASLIIPIAAFIAAGLYKNPKIYIYIWFLSIPLSLVGGSVWSSLFSSLGFAEDRTEGYLSNGEQFQDQFSQTGFRWDFLLYSASAIFAGWYFIFKKKITDVFYLHLFGVYCIANSFWVLVITAAFSNRFAYLSWFLMPSVIAYPMFRYKIWKDQYKVFGIILFIYFLFTYFMNVIK